MSASPDTLPRVSTPYASEAYLHQILGKALTAGASDVHLKVGQAPGARVRGDMVFFKSDKLRPDDTAAAARIILGRSINLDTLHERVLAYDPGPPGRFRASIFRQHGALSLILRPIPTKIPTLDELGLPPEARAAASRREGLFVVAGGAASGKSTTLAAMIAHVRDHAPRHVVTVEDPIEFLFGDGRASISQREVGTDADSAPAAIRAALLQDADVVMVSSIDDAASLSAALDVATSGRLVLAGLRALNAPAAWVRLEALAGADHARLEAALAGILAQRLVSRADGKGFELSVEMVQGKTGAA